jgi:molecular chaperone GrpE
VDGIILIDRKLRGTLESMGLSAIEAVGKPFDPNIHEAVMQGQGEDGMVIAELEKGYRFQDRIIRPTKVVVGSGEE